ncbi:MAG: thiamine biosynthesis lipoprotein ApbE [Pseudomonadota bacterium]|jgi:thiamine biosynthesis lipoprotein
MLAIPFIAVACQQPETKEIELAGNAQGTTYHIKFVQPSPPLAASELHKQIEARFAELDSKLSNYRDDSEIAQINRQTSTDWISVSPEIMEELVVAQQVYRLSDGCYDITVKPLFDLWGFSRHEGKVPDETAIRETLQKIGGHYLELDPPNHRIRKHLPLLRIDLSSIAQGYSVEQMAKLLENAGISNYLAEIGGEMKARGHKASGQPWRVAIEKPLPNTQEVSEVLTVTQASGTAIMTSGTYRNYFEESGRTYSHILDPSTGRPVTHKLLSTTVLHPDPTWADAWSTALLCLGEERGFRIAEQENLRAVFIYGEQGELRERYSTAFNESH